MNKEDFFKEIQETLDCETILTEGTDLTMIDEWDSLAMLRVITFFNHSLGITLTFQELKNVKTVADLFNLTEKGNK